MKLSKEKEKEIIKFIGDNSLKIYWDYNDYLSKNQIKKILSSEGGLFDLEEELWEYNIDYMCDIEYELCKNIIDEFDLNEDEEDVREYFLDYLGVDLNIKELIAKTGNITGLVVVHSNYDCCNSFDNTKEPYSYLSEVFKRVKTGVRRKDYEFEFYNGAYGGSLFCFVFKTDIMTFRDLKYNFKNSITIPKGTQFGFFSSFQGAGSVFEKTTYRNMTLLKVEPNETEYDCINLIADVEQSYNLIDVYGSDRFINEQDITVN